MIAFSKTKLACMPILYILAILISMTGCAPLQTPTTTLPPAPATPEPPAPLPEPAEPEPSVDPRLMASVQLTDQGRILLDQGRIDDAIRTLERAISLSPRNGKTYYYMAEAWLAKGAYKQAAEYNRLSSMYLEDTRWSVSVAEQRRAIDSRLKGPQ
jgi:tetratricopeptide (TPR) repeat protein